MLGKEHPSSNQVRRGVFNPKKSVAYAESYHEKTILPKLLLLHESMRHTAAFGIRT